MRVTHWKSEPLKSKTFYVLCVCILIQVWTFIRLWLMEVLTWWSEAHQWDPPIYWKSQLLKNKLFYILCLCIFVQDQFIWSFDLEKSWNDGVKLVSWAQPTYWKLEPLKMKSLLVQGMSPMFYFKRNWSPCMIDHLIKNVINEYG